jgi:hypothetical protein
MLKPETRDLARAIHSLMEELEAIDWYGQRADVTEDEELRRILEHNRDEEKEHAAMLLEWIRRHDQQLDENLKKYLFSSGDVVEAEQTPGETPVPVALERSESPDQAVEPEALTVGSLRPPRANSPTRNPQSG